jgi:HEAT repeat protein
MELIAALDTVEKIDVLNERSVALLELLCEHVDAEVRFRAIEKIVFLTENIFSVTKFITLVNECLKDSDELVRCTALEFFENHPEVASLDVCIAMLDDSDPLVRTEAARVIGNIKNRDAIPALSRAIQSAEEYEKVSLNFALFQIEPSFGIEPILQLLDSTDYRARVASANLLPVFAGTANAKLVVKRLKLSLLGDDSRASILAKSAAFEELTSKPQ